MNTFQQAATINKVAASLSKAFPFLRPFHARLSYYSSNNNHQSLSSRIRRALTKCRDCSRERCIVVCRCTTHGWRCFLPLYASRDYKANLPRIRFVHSATMRFPDRSRFQTSRLLDIDLSFFVFREQASFFERERLQLNLLCSLDYFQFDGVPFNSWNSYWIARKVPFFG